MIVTYVYFCFIITQWQEEKIEVKNNALLPKIISSQII